ncbi:MAG: 5'/3'-nucleotidase SurE [Deltaproteobacteria bacterium]|nr:5'/3'-nucleotidase SurE [Deltaproteobacteria bacterium]
MIRILLTNDDGIDAPGLRALEAAFDRMDGVECWTVAPDSQRSACSHSMSLGKPVSIQKRGPRRFAHSGVVADGVYFALVHLMADTRPDLVVAGINSGANLSEDVIYSGTVAGAREAVLRNVHGLAVSLVSGDDFSHAAPNAAQIAVQIARRGGNSPLLFNLNYPAGAFEGPVLCSLGTRPYQPLVRPVADKGEMAYLLGGPPVVGVRHEPGTDVALIEQGKASMTPLVINQTAYGVLEGNQLQFLEGMKVYHD